MKNVSQISQDTEQAPSVASLSVHNLSLMRGQLYLCQDWNMHVLAGECVHLAGPNGCGKTSFLQALTGLLRPEAGEIYWQGRALSQAGNDVRQLWHYVTHQNALKDGFTVYENAQMNAQLCGSTVSHEQVMQALQAMQLMFLADTPVYHLSQGQKRRAALLKLYLTQRPVCLLDEPFNALDEAGRQELATWMNQHCAAGGSVIFTSHFAWPEHLQVDRTVIFGRSSKTVEAQVSSDSSKKKSQDMTAQLEVDTATSRKDTGLEGEAGQGIKAEQRGEQR
ncbi:MAG: heme ABC exporter ATP-binding protein CcmA [Pelistega sp.]|nr:heme ABC exporter ATP-binding protein CcmA [Pelistega sp.]